MGIFSGKKFKSCTIKMDQKDFRPGFILFLILLLKAFNAQCLRLEKKVHFGFEAKFWVKTSSEYSHTLF